MDLSSIQRRRPMVGLTSLIDVIFILIVFFMLVSSFSQFRTLDLGKAEGTGQSIDNPFILNLMTDGTLVSTSTQSVDSLLEKALLEQSLILIQLSKDVAVQTGVNVLDDLKKRGLTNISLRAYKETSNETR